MDYKEKLKAIINSNKTPFVDINTFLKYFPELKDSEDELHRKWILEYLYDGLRKSDEQFKDHFKAAISWLEKQGEQKPAWSEEDEAIYYGVIETEQYMLDVVNGIKKFNVGNISIKEECTRELNWLESLKDRVLLQPKQEWSEEDKNMLQSILDEYKSMPIEKRNWLKFLKDRYTWKPSDKQMEALHAKLSYVNGDRELVPDVILESLYNDLKKLREE